MAPARTAMTRAAMTRAVVASVHPESPRFHASLLFVHGLWGDPGRWRRPMGFFAHRGWQCHAVDLTPSAAPADHAAVLAGVARELDPPPVLVGHDAGALLALGCSAPAPVAVVAIAPLLPRELRRRSLAPAAAWRQRWAVHRGRPVPPPRDGAAWFGMPAAPRAPGESPVWVRSVDAWVPRPAPAPALVVVPRGDAIAAPDEQEALARCVGADVLHLDGGHALPVGAGWETCVAAVHRWLVQRLGAPLLAWADADDGAAP